MSITGDLRTILKADPVLTGILPGGIFGVPLDPKGTETKDAWVANPQTGIKRLRPCAVMLDPQEVDSPFGLNPGRRLDVDQWPELVIYAEATDMEATFDPADTRAMELLHGQRIGLAEITATGYRARPLEADELSGNIWTTLRRYRAQLSRHIGGA
jgi:hypothetical protein